MCADYFYLATLFLAKKEAYQARLHAEKCLEIRKTIYPVGHRNIRKGEEQEYIKSSLNDHTLFLFF